MFNQTCLGTYCQGDRHNIHNRQTGTHLTKLKSEYFMFFFSFSFLIRQGEVNFAAAAPYSSFGSNLDQYSSNQKCNPKLDTRISVLRTSAFVTLRVPPLDSEMGWTGEVWSNHGLLILENYENCIFFRKYLFIYLFLFLLKKVVF